MSKAEEELGKYDRVLTVDFVYKGREYKIPIYKFMENYLWIKTKKDSETKGRPKKFVLNDEQVDLYREICEQVIAKKPVRFNLLKARQIGFSTFVAGLYFCLTIFKPNRTALIIADTAEHATNLFRKYTFMYEKLPEELKIPRLKNNAKELMVDYGNGDTSSIKIVVADENAARSDTADYVHCSECAFWKCLEDTLSSVSETVPFAEETFIILETTANGYNEYKRAWDEDVRMQNDVDSVYVPRFYPWWGNKEYSRPYRGFSLNEWEIELQKRHNLTLEQMQWYHDKWVEKKKNRDLLFQENPSSPYDAFIATGNSVFDLALVNARREELIKRSAIVRKGRFAYSIKWSEDATRVDVGDIKFVDNEFGALEIYEEPRRGHPYIVNCDPAMGGEDYYVVQVLDNATTRQVARYRARRVNDDEVAYQMICLGHYYNEAMVSSETNTTGYLLNIVYKSGYENIYQDKDIDLIDARYQDRFGYKTKTTNRNQMISLFKEHFRDNYRFINDLDTLNEMENFQIIRTETSTSTREKAMAIAGEHDDLVMAMAGIFLIRNEMRYSIEDDMERESSYHFNPFNRVEDRKSKERENVYQIWD